MSQVVVVGGGFGGLAAAVRLAKLGHEVTLVERTGTLGGALVGGERRTASPGTPGRRTRCCRRWCATCSASPAGRSSASCELVPLDVVREHRFEDGTSVRVPGGRAPRSSRRSTSSAPGSGSAGSTTSRRTPTTGRCCAAATSRTRGSPTTSRRELAARLDSREMLHKRLKKTFKDERLRLVAGHPFVAEGHDLRNVPAWAGRRRRTSSSGSARGPSRAGWPGSAPRSPTGWRPARVTVLTGTTATDLVVRDGRVVGGRDDRRRARRRRRGVRGRPARAARAGAVRRAHDARDPAGRRAPRPVRRRRPTCRTSWCCTATRCSSSAPAAGAPRAAR